MMDLSGFDGLQRAVPLQVTPEGALFEEVEAQINFLQDELDKIRQRARRAFQMA